MKKLLFIISAVICICSNTLLSGEAPLDDDKIIHLMKENQVPGVSLTLIDNGEIVFSKGYGKTSGVLGKPVDNETLFQMASISKPVVAAVALQLVDRGILSLETPVISYLKTPYLEKDDRTSSITLHELLNHTAGLSNNLFPKDKRLVNNPGEKFLYSGIGYDYLTEVIKQATGKTLQENAEKLFFETVGMNNSSFKMPYMMTGNEAPPSMPVMYHIIVSIVPLLLIILILTIFLSIWRRILKKQKVMQRYFFLVLFVSILLELIIVALLLVKLVLIVSIVVALFFIIYMILTRLIKKQKISFLITILIFTIVAFIPVQLPFDITPPGESAAYSLVSNSAELGKFVQCLVDDSNNESWKNILKKDVVINSTDSWGLGIGLCEYEGRSIAWHTGINTGATSLFVVDLTNKKAVICITNGNNGIEVGSKIVSEYMGIDKKWDVNIESD